MMELFLFYDGPGLPCLYGRFRGARVGECLLLFTTLYVIVTNRTRGGGFSCGFCKRIHNSLFCGSHTGTRVISKLFRLCPGSGGLSTSNGSLGTATGKDFCLLCSHLKMSIAKPGVKGTIAATGLRTSFHNSKDG